MDGANVNVSRGILFKFLNELMDIYIYTRIFYFAMNRVRRQTFQQHYGKVSGRTEFEMDYLYLYFQTYWF
jgi:hypothetical protein